MHAALLQAGHFGKKIFIKHSQKVIHKTNIYSIRLKNIKKCNFKIISYVQEKIEMKKKYLKTRELLLI